MTYNELCKQLDYGWFYKAVREVTTERKTIVMTLSTRDYNELSWNLHTMFPKRLVSADIMSFPEVFYVSLFGTQVLVIPEAVFGLMKEGQIIVGMIPTNILAPAKEKSDG